MKKIGLVIFLFVCHLSCQNHKDSENTREIQINGEHAFRGVNLNIPIEILSIEDYLIIKNDSRVEPFFETYDTRTESKINSFGKKGKGPGEMIFPGSVFFSEELEKLFIHDPILSQILYINDLDLFSSVPSPKKYCEFPREGFYPFKTLLLDSCFVMQGVSKESERWQFHPIGSKYNHIKGYYREDLIQGKIDGISSFRKLMALMGSVKVVANEENDRIATIFNYSDLIEIYDVQKDSIIGSSDFEQPIIRNYSGNGLNDLARIDKQNIIGYHDICVANDLIYCLYSDMTVSDVLESGNRGHGNEIHVFDWNAEFLCKLILDIPVHCITYDKINNTIIGIRDAPEPEIIYFNNPKIR